jgi:hypothetical protein
MKSVLAVPGNLADEYQCLVRNGRITDGVNVYEAKYLVIVERYKSVTRYVGLACVRVPTCNRVGNKSFRSSYPVWRVRRITHTNSRTS